MHNGSTVFRYWKLLFFIDVGLVVLDEVDRGFGLLWKRFLSFGLMDRRNRVLYDLRDCDLDYIRILLRIPGFCSGLQ